MEYSSSYENSTVNNNAGYILSNLVEDRKIAQGGAGMIFVDSESKYAIKKLTLSANVVIAAREISILRRCKSKYIVSIIDYMMSNRELSYAMPYAPKSIRNNLSLLSLSDKIDISYRLVMAVNYLHTRNIIHRDITIANILYFGGTDVQLADFSSSKLMNCHQDNLNHTLATGLVYRAPEILLYGDDYGMRPYTISADLWALGCVLYHIITTEFLIHPAYGNNDIDALKQIYRIFGTPNNDFPPGDYKLWPRETKQERIFIIEDKIILSANVAAKDLLLSLLRLNPAERLPTSDLLKLKFFRGYDIPASVSCFEALQLRERYSVRSVYDDKILNPFLADLRNITKSHHSIFFYTLALFDEINAIVGDSIEDYITGCLNIAIEYFGYDNMISLSATKKTWSIVRNILNKIAYDLVFSTAYDFLLLYSNGHPTSRAIENLYGYYTSQMRFLMLPSVLAKKSLSDD